MARKAKRLVEERESCLHLILDPVKFYQTLQLTMLNNSIAVTRLVGLLLLLLLLNEYYLHAVKQKSCKSMLQT